MPTAYAYLRYSSKAQGGDDKDSIDRQMKSIRALTSQYSVELLPENIYRDDGISSFDGTNKKTGKLKDLIDLILNQSIKKGDIVFVESIDRLSRQKFRISKDLVYSILDKGVILITTIDNRVYQKTEDNQKEFEQDLYLTLIAQRAHEESKTKSIRRKSAWNKAKERAEKENKIFNAHNPPYGIIYNKEKEKFEIEEEKAEEIRFIFRSLQNFGVSNTIKRVNEFSIKKWTNKTIEILIDSKYPLGYYKAQKRDENKRKVFDRYIENYYPQIITFEEYNNAINSIKERAKRKNYGKHSVSSLNIFRHCVFCFECGASLFFETNKNQKGLKFSYLHCSVKKEQKIGCEAKRMRFENALGLLIKTVGHCFEDYEFIKNYKDEQLSEMLFSEIKEKQKNFKSEEFDDLNNIFGYSLEDIEKVKNYKKEDEEINELELYLKRIKFARTIIELLSGKNKENSGSGEIKLINNLLIKEKITLENLKKSVEELDGAIPKFVLEKMLTTENNIEKYEIEINTLKNQVVDKKTLKVSSLKDFIALIKTEDGRIELNSFFIKNNIYFKFGFLEFDKKPLIEIYKDNKWVYSFLHKFDLHNPLKDYDFTKISDYE